MGLLLRAGLFCCQGGGEENNVTRRYIAVEEKKTRNPLLLFAWPRQQFRQVRGGFISYVAKQAAAHKRVQIIKSDKEAAAAKV